MKLTFDRAHNIAYLRRRPRGAQVQTVRVSDELNVDIAPDGSVYGIELLNANEQLRAADDGKLVLVDEAAGKQFELPLSRAEAGLRRPHHGARSNTLALFGVPFLIATGTGSPCSSKTLTVSEWPVLFTSMRVKLSSWVNP